ncbi:MAG: YIP1 family protein [Rhodobacteraceae bacterium]|nr:YIP1 family protein [Paracoccaceae bacterium]
MSIVADITRSYAQPRAVIHARLTEGQREDRALMLLMLGCGLVFVAQWPVLARAAALDEAVPLEARLGGALMAWGVIMPLACYGIAAVSHLIARSLGGQGGYYGARLALFWALVASAPAWLLNGLVAGLIGPGAALNIVGFLAFAAFLWIWLSGLAEAEWPRRVAAP